HSGLAGVWSPCPVTAKPVRVRRLVRLGPEPAFPRIYRPLTQQANGKSDGATIAPTGRRSVARFGSDRPAHGPSSSLWRRSPRGSGLRNCGPSPTSWPIGRSSTKAPGQPRGAILIRRLGGPLGRGCHGPTATYGARSRGRDLVNSGPPRR